MTWLKLNVVYPLFAVFCAAVMAVLIGGALVAGVVQLITGG